MKGNFFKKVSLFFFVFFSMPEVNFAGSEERNKRTFVDDNSSHYTRLKIMDENGKLQHKNNPQHVISVKNLENGFLHLTASFQLFFISALRVVTGNSYRKENSFSIK